MSEDVVGNSYWVGDFGDARLKKTELICWNKLSLSKRCVCAKWEVIEPVKLNLGVLSGTPK
jgi:hypothetical protein